MIERFQASSANADAAWENARFIADLSVHVGGLVKLIVGLLLALSMIGSPVAARALPAAAKASAVCTTPDAEKVALEAHEEMGRCKLACGTFAPAAILPDDDADTARPSAIVTLERLPDVGRLPSFELATDHPPPRTFFV